MSARKYTLVICNMNNEFMDPGYAPFLFSGGDEMFQSDGINGALNLVPKIYTVAKAILQHKGNVFFHEEGGVTLGKKTVVPLDRLKIDHGVDENDVNDNVYVCGIVNNKTEKNKICKRYSNVIPITDLILGEKITTNKKKSSKEFLKTYTLKI